MSHPHRAQGIEAAALVYDAKRPTLPFGGGLVIAFSVSFHTMKFALITFGQWLTRGHWFVRPLLCVIFVTLCAARGALATTAVQKTSTRVRPLQVYELLKKIGGSRIDPGIKLKKKLKDELAGVSTPEEKLDVIEQAFNEIRVPQPGLILSALVRPTPQKIEKVKRTLHDQPHDAFASQEFDEIVEALAETFPNGVPLTHARLLNRSGTLEHLRETTRNYDQVNEALVKVIKQKERETDSTERLRLQAEMVKLDNMKAGIRETFLFAIDNALWRARVIENTAKPKEYGERFLEEGLAAFDDLRERKKFPAVLNTFFSEAEVLRNRLEENIAGTLVHLKKIANDYKKKTAQLKKLRHRLEHEKDLAKRAKLKRELTDRLFAWSSIRSRKLSLAVKNALLRHEVIEDASTASEYANRFREQGLAAFADLRTKKPIPAQLDTLLREAENLRIQFNWDPPGTRSHLAKRVAKYDQIVKDLVKLRQQREQETDPAERKNLKLEVKRKTVQRARIRYEQVPVAVAGALLRDRVIADAEKARVFGRQFLEQGLSVFDDLRKEQKFSDELDAFLNEAQAFRGRFESKAVSEIHATAK